MLEMSCNVYRVFQELSSLIYECFTVSLGFQVLG